MICLKNIGLFFLCLIFVSCFEEQKQQIFPKQYAIPDIEKSLIKKSNELGFQNFRHILRNKDEDLNILISPLCSYTSFNVLTNASGNSLRDVVKGYLGQLSVPDSSLTKSYDYLHNIVTEIDKNTFFDDSAIVGLQHELIPENNFKLFIDRNKYTSISNHLYPTINDEEVNGFYLTNSIRFKARGQFQKKVEELPFYYNPDKSGFVPMIVSEAMYNYYGDANLMALELPLGRGNYIMLVIVPQESQELDDLALKLDMRLIDKIRSRFKLLNLEVFMPKLHKSAITSYTDILKERLGACFNPKQADFSGLCSVDKYYLAHFEQVINFELDYISNPDLDYGEEKNNIDQNMKSSVFIDHPFLFVVYEKYADAILFIGKILNP